MSYMRLHFLGLLCLIPGFSVVALAQPVIPVPVKKPLWEAKVTPLPARKPEAPKEDFAISEKDINDAPKPSKATLHQDQARTRQAANALYKGQIDEAYRLAAISLKSSNVHVPLAGWVAGLAAWQRGEYKLAARVFEITVASPKVEPWTHSAAAYWAARAHSRAGGSSRDMRALLEQAAQHSDTFYGLLAARSLGRDMQDHAQAHALPVKGWMKPDDYKVDPALVHAIIRQESKFNSRAKSHKGAQGLMQILPATARGVTGKKSNNLMEPMTNLKIGQRYLLTLLEDDAVQGDMMAMLMAYNAGPGNLAKWRGRMDDMQDPLLFIEMIPLAETRAYVERVMAGYWLYRLRAELPAPGLDSLAAGRIARYPAVADWQAVNVASR